MQCALMLVLAGKVPQQPPATTTTGDARPSPDDGAAQKQKQNETNGTGAWPLDARAYGEGRRLCEAHVHSGAALQRLRRLVRAQGGSEQAEAVLDKSRPYPRALRSWCAPACVAVGGVGDWVEGVRYIHTHTHTHTHTHMNHVLSHTSGMCVRGGMGGWEGSGRGR